MNDPNQSFSSQSYDVNQANSFLQYNYEEGLRESLKMQKDNFTVYDNYQQNQHNHQFNSIIEQQGMSHYQEGDSQTYQEAAYQEYSINENDPYNQLSPAEFSPIPQNISPSSFSSENRSFYQDQLVGSPPAGPYYQQQNVPSLHQSQLNITGNDDAQHIQSMSSSISDISSQNKAGFIATIDAKKPVNGILEMEGSVEPNGPILGGHGYIPAQTMQKAYYELGETPEIKAACIRGLRQQIEIHQEENNFDEHSDAFLLKFLRNRKFDVEAAYALLEKYYDVRENKPEVFRNLTRKNVKRTMEQGIVGVLPQRDKKGRVIITFNFSKWNMSLPFHFEKLLRVFVYTLEKLFESEETQINGFVVICNLSQLSVLQTKSLGAPMIEKIVEIFQVRVHFMNPMKNRQALV